MGLDGLFGRANKKEALTNDQSFENDEKRVNIVDTALTAAAIGLVGAGSVMEGSALQKSTDLNASLTEHSDILPVGHKNPTLGKTSDDAPDAITIEKH